MTLFERKHTPAFAGATEWLNSEPLVRGLFVGERMNDVVRNSV